MQALASVFVPCICVGVSVCVCANVHAYTHMHENSSVRVTGPSAGQAGRAGARGVCGVYWKGREGGLAQEDTRGCSTLLSVTKTAVRNKLRGRLHSAIEIDWFSAEQTITNTPHLA